MVRIVQTVKQTGDLTGAVFGQGFVPARCEAGQVFGPDGAETVEFLHAVLDEVVDMPILVRRQVVVFWG